MKPSSSFSPPWTYPLALLVAVLVVVAALHTGELKIKDILTPVLAIFGTFFGATFAFRLNEAKDFRSLSNSRREALNRALFTLARQTNAVHQLSRDFQKYTSRFERAFNMPAMKPPTYADLVFNMAELDFLLESTNPSILFILSIEEERFHQTISAIQIRNEFYVDEVQKALSAQKINGKATTAAKLEALLGDRLFHGAMNGADMAWQHVTNTNLSLHHAQTELLKLAKEIFPGHKFISYEKVEAAAPEEPAKSFETSKIDYRWK